MKYHDLFRTAGAVALSIVMAAVPAMAKPGNGPKAKAPRAQAAKAPNARAPRATTQKPQVSSTAAARSNFFTDPASGFKNSGQYRAAVNNANNHDLNFWQLKNLMVNQGMSLGQAKKQLKAVGGPRRTSLGKPAVAARPPSTTAPGAPSTTPRHRQIDPAASRPSTTAPGAPSTTPRHRQIDPAASRPSTTAPGAPSTTPRHRQIDPAASRPSTTARKVKDKS